MGAACLIKLMPKIAYRPKAFNESHQSKINKANAIIEEYRQQGFELTLRQLYYQFVSRGYIANNVREYKNLGSVINDGRLAGLIDWDAIVDRTRDLRSLAHWGSPSEIIEACAKQYRIDKWADQERRIEVWIEKDALVGVIEPICNEMDIAYFSCRGYTSQSEMWEAAQRLRRYKKAGQAPLVLHFGDHDPSGIDMSRDINARLNEFSYINIELRRLALNMDQVEQYNPPPNPAKLTDSRCKGYMEDHGDESWELDALEPSVIASLIQSEIESERDQEKWDEAVTEEAKQREQLQKVSDNWDDICSNEL